MFKITIDAPLKQYVVLIRTPNVQKEGNWRALVAEQPQSATSMQMPRTRREELRVQVLALVILCLRLDVAPKPGQYRRMLGILVEFLDLDTEPLTKLQRRLQRQAPFVRQAAQCLFHARPADGRVYPGKAQRRPKAQRAQDVKVSLVVFRVHVPDHQEIRPVVMRQLVHLAVQHRQYPLQVGVDRNASGLLTMVSNPHSRKRKVINPGNHRLMVVRQAGVSLRSVVARSKQTL